MTLIQAIILAIVEGITEFLPISSTGHMIIASSLMGIADQPFTKVFTVVIQFGAILSVVVLYWKKFLGTINFNFYLKLFVAFIPAALAGVLLKDQINYMLENVLIVASALLIGGVIFLMIDKWFHKAEAKGRIEVTGNAQAFKIGMFQVIAMIPGVSRSAATIIGGLTQGLNKRGAAEFSFFLAVPTMFGATVKDLYDVYSTGNTFSNNEWFLLLVGNIVAFLVAMIAIKSFINYLAKHGFKLFGYYRIIVGLTILILYLAGIELSII